MGFVANDRRCRLPVHTGLESVATQPTQPTCLWNLIRSRTEERSSQIRRIAAPSQRIKYHGVGCSANVGTRGLANDGLSMPILSLVNDCASEPQPHDSTGLSSCLCTPSYTYSLGICTITSTCLYACLFTICMSIYTCLHMCPCTLQTCLCMCLNMFIHSSI